MNMFIKKTLVNSFIIKKKRQTVTVVTEVSLVEWLGSVLDWTSAGPE